MFLYVFLRTALKSDLLHTVLYTNCPPPYKRHRVVANPILRVLPKRADSIIQVMSKFTFLGQLVCVFADMHAVMYRPRFKAYWADWEDVHKHVRRGAHRRITINNKSASVGSYTSPFCFDGGTN